MRAGAAVVAGDEVWPIRPPVAARAVTATPGGFCSSGCHLCSTARSRLAVCFILAQSRPPPASPCAALRDFRDCRAAEGAARRGGEMARACLLGGGGRLVVRFWRIRLPCGHTGQFDGVFLLRVGISNGVVGQDDVSMIPIVRQRRTLHGTASRANPLGADHRPAVKTPGRVALCCYPPPRLRRPLPVAPESNGQRKSCALPAVPGKRWNGTFLAARRLCELESTPRPNSSQSPTGPELPFRFGSDVVIGPILAPSPLMPRG